MKISKIIHDIEHQQFKMKIDEHTAYIEYNIHNGKKYLVHTLVPLALKGQGIGRILVEKTFEYLQEKNIHATPVCSYIRSIQS